MELLRELAGFLPAIVFPLATVLQLLEILRRKSVKGVSVSAWFWFGVGNLGLWFHVGQMTLPTIAAMGLTAVLDFAIAGAVLARRLRYA